jgi:hypothetical protein
MSAFEGFTFDPAAGTTVSAAGPKRANIDRDLNDVVREANLERRRARGAKPKDAKTARPPARGEGKAARGKDDAARKRSWDIDVPEAALRAILEGAGVAVPDGVALRLVAQRRPDK